jgi:NAD(P)-dependent dehydrogenase (short-subunit alcohol dehydrogenase family)
MSGVRSEHDHPLKAWFRGFEQPGLGLAYPGDNEDLFPGREYINHIRPNCQDSWIESEEQTRSIAPRMPGPPVWLITGCSQGLGRALFRHVLAQGHRIIASSRNPSKTPELVAEVEEKGSKWVQLDVTSSDLKETIAEAEEIFGRIDFLVNMAGYAVMGAMEDIPYSEIVAQMDANFYGPVRLMQAILPGMRQRGSGTIINVSSAQGFCPSPANGIYAASKAALEAASESLSEEVASFGIRVLIVAPGAFRTGFGSAGATLIKSSAPYSSEEHVVGKRLGWVSKLAGAAKGSPGKAAKVIFETATERQQLFLRLIIGPDCWKRIDEKASVLQRTVDAQKELAASTDF